MSKFDSALALAAAVTLTGCQKDSKDSVEASQGEGPLKTDTIDDKSVTALVERKDVCIYYAARHQWKWSKRNDKSNISESECLKQDGKETFFHWWKSCTNGVLHFPDTGCTGHCVGKADHTGCGNYTKSDCTAKGKGGGWCQWELVAQRRLDFAEDEEDRSSPMVV